MTEFLRQHRYLPLLLVFIAWFLLAPLIQSTEIDRQIVNALFALVLGAALYAFKGKDNHIVFKAIIPLGIFLLIIARFITDTQIVHYALLGFVSLFLVYLFTAIFKDIITAKEVIGNTLIGACCSYFLLGLLFAAIYIAINSVQPGGFYGINPDDPNDRPFIYYSYVTLTTLGYGDIYPTTQFGRSIATLQAIIGQLYLTILMAILVGSYLNKKQ